MNIAPYRKALVAAGAVIAELLAVTVDGDLTANEGVALALALLAALGVYQATNAPTVDA